MLISYTHKFIFVHIYKTAGTSISRAFGRYAYKPNLLLRCLNKIGVKLSNPRWRIFPPHVYAFKLKNDLLKESFKDYFKFAFVRNPWDWQVSLYHYMLQDTSHFQQKLIKGMRNFDEYIYWRVSEDKHLQKEFVADDNGQIIVDFIGKYENLINDFDNVCQTLNISASLPHLQKSNHRNYKTYYNDKSKRLVEEHFKEDIELFGYNF